MLRQTDVAKRGRGCAIPALLTFVISSLAAPPPAKDSPNSKPQPASSGKEVPQDPFPGRKPKAPALEGGVAWLNTAGPIDLSKLKGKVVLLDFWTYCCINCMHILPDLDKLEREFAKELVVIGVHSAKFDGEKDSENIRGAILRYDIRHPVVNDANMAIWQTYGVRAWPTQVLIDPEGYVIGALSGEGNYETFRLAIRKLVDYHKAKGTLDDRPLHFELEAYGSARTPLRFPGKVFADPATKRLYIADSSHHRIVVAHLDTGAVEHVIGAGEAGLRDGGFRDAQFHDPQGLAARGEVLYVADRKNHAVRKIDLATRRVTIVAGTGVQAGFERRGGPAPSTPLSSPWDLLWIDNTLWIAMAGNHQIWKYDLAANQVHPHAGSGRENLVDGSLRSSAFAQPSGLATDGEWVYVADSEVSAIRRIHLQKDEVGTLVGQGLFDFGDIDGDARKARLQHALGVAYADGVLYVADTYNNKVKTIDPKRFETKTFVGDGKAGATNQPPRFDEPGGIHLADGKLYVADTNNHLIRVIEVKTRQVSTMALRGLEAPATTEARPAPLAVNSIDRPAAVLTSKEVLDLSVSIPVPGGSKLNPKAPLRYRIERMTTGGKGVVLAEGRLVSPTNPARITTKGLSLEGVERLRITVIYYTCEDGSEGVCRVESLAWNVPVSFDLGKGAGVLQLTAP